MLASQFAVGTMPATLAISALRVASAARKAANVGAVSITGSAPSAASLCASSACLEAACTAALSSATSSDDIPFGPHSAYQSMKVRPGNPASPMVGTAGS